MYRKGIERRTQKKGNIGMFLWIAIVSGMICFFVFGIRNDAASLPAAPKGVLANGVGDKIVVSWEPVNGADGYVIYEKQEGQKAWSVLKMTKKKKIVLSGRQAGSCYRYKVRAVVEKDNGELQYGAFSKKSDTTLPEHAVTTIKNFLKLSLAPVGTTMYIWGGGWNKTDDGAGKDALRIGLNPQWRMFAGKQSSSYDYKKYRYRWGNGLDCSGFVGWSVYNALHTTKGDEGEGYVDKAKNLAKNYAEYGWGTFKKSSMVKDYKAGDIMSGSGHVYIVLGACQDGSVVLVHSSPAGVQICGTQTPAGQNNSQAIKLAKKYMKKYYPSWYRRFPDCSRDASYLQYTQFRWDIREGNVMEDTNQYTEKSAKAILKDLLEGK